MFLCFKKHFLQLSYFCCQRQYQLQTTVIKQWNRGFNSPALKTRHMHFCKYFLSTTDSTKRTNNRLCSTSDLPEICNTFATQIIINSHPFIVSHVNIFNQLNWCSRWMTSSWGMKRLVSHTSWNHVESVNRIFLVSKLLSCRSYCEAFVIKNASILVFIEYWKRMRRDTFNIVSRQGPVCRIKKESSENYLNKNRHYTPIKVLMTVPCIKILFSQKITAMHQWTLTHRNKVWPKRFKQHLLKLHYSTQFRL